MDHVIIGSPSYDEYFKNVLKLDKKTTFAPLPSLVEENNAEPHKYEKKFNVLYCGNLGLIQNIETIPEVMKRIDNPDVQFHVIGMGPKSDELVSLIKENQLDDKLVYHGPIPAKRAASYFASADALYVSLKDEGYVGKTIPNKLVMSMAFGKPIIGVVGGDGKKLLEESRGGVVCENNPDQIADAINQLYSKTIDERKKLGENNRTFYLNNLSIKMCGEKVNKVLSDELL